MAYALPASIDDDGIADSCADGSTEGFDLLYRMYAPALRDFCGARLGDRSEAEDACHETLCKAHAAMNRFRRGDRMWPWLATIAAHVCIDMQRKQRFVSLDDELGAPGPAADPEELALERLRADLVGEAFEAVPDRYRAALKLRELEGWRYAEIAELQKTSVAAVRSSLMRGRAMLRERIREMAERKELWPLPAVVPGGVLRRWQRRLDRVLRQPAVVTAGDLGGAIMASLPNVANAAVAALALVGGVTALGGAEAPSTAPPTAEISFSPPAPAQAPDAAGSGTTTGAGSDSVVVEIEPADAAVTTRTSSDLHDEEVRTLDGRVWAKLPVSDEHDLGGGASMGCDAGVIGETSCRAVDALPDDHNAENGDTDE